MGRGMVMYALKFKDLRAGHLRPHVQQAYGAEHYYNGLRTPLLRRIAPLATNPQQSNVATNICLGDICCEGGGVVNVNTILYSYTRNLRTLRIFEIIQASMMHKAMPLAALASTHRR